MHQIDVHKLSDEAKFNGFHRLVLLACALITIFATRSAACLRRCSAKA